MKKISQQNLITEKIEIIFIKSADFNSTWMHAQRWAIYYGPVYLKWIVFFQCWLNHAFVPERKSLLWLFETTWNQSFKNSDTKSYTKSFNAVLNKTAGHFYNYQNESSVTVGYVIVPSWYCFKESDFCTLILSYSKIIISFSKMNRKFRMDIL